MHRTLEHRHTLKVAENNDVSNNVIKLQQGVVADLAMISTNPSVPPISAQALAGYHVFTWEQLVIPDHLLDLYFNQLKGEAFRVSNNSLGYDPMQRGKLERYARAFELLVMNEFVSAYWFTPKTIFLAAAHGSLLQTLSPPRDLNEAFLMNLNGYTKANIRADPFVDFILSQGPIPISQVRQWRLKQLLESSKELNTTATIQKWDKVILKTILSMSRSGEFTLQEIFAIHIFHNHHSLQSSGIELSPSNESNSDELSEIPSEVCEDDICISPLLTVVSPQLKESRECYEILYLRSSKEYSR